MHLNDARVSRTRHMEMISAAVADQKAEQMDDESVVRPELAHEAAAVR